MNYLKQFKYSKDDPAEFDINPNLNKNDNKIFDDSHLSNLLSRSIRVEKEIFPTVGNAIEKVFKRLDLENKRLSLREAKGSFVVFREKGLEDIFVADDL